MWEWHDPKIFMRWRSLFSIKALLDMHKSFLGGPWYQIKGWIVQLFHKIHCMLICHSQAPILVYTSEDSQQSQQQSQLHRKVTECEMIEGVFKDTPWSINVEAKTARISNVICFFIQFTWWITFQAQFKNEHRGGARKRNLSWCFKQNVSQFPSLKLENGKS